nr:hypothetical protein [Silvibacterium dinghuense]
MLGKITRAFVDEVNDALVDLDVFPPYISGLSGGENADAGKSEERQDDPARVVEKIWIAGETAELEVEGEIPVEHVFGIVFLECLAHLIERRCERSDVGRGLCNEPRCQAFKNTPQGENLQHILFRQADDAGTPAGCLGDESILRQDVDGFPDRSLSDAETASPSPLDDTHPGKQGTGGDFIP